MNSAKLILKEFKVKKTLHVINYHHIAPPTCDIYTLSSIVYYSISNNDNNNNNNIMIN